ncbi:SIR2 family protein [Shewanella psychromarinicola]|uniref:SIR2 family protein n=1 Tax=Shewanella psychromarinicola TaxID=2487742 RepID=UPI003F4B5C74
MYQDAAKVSQEKLSGGRWHKFIQSQFSVDFKTLDETCKLLPQAIWQLSNRVVTLNYDKVLEWAHVEPANICVFDNANNSQLAEFTRSSSQEMLWHLHGKIDDPKHMVLTPQSYHRLYQENAEVHYQAALTKFKELITNKVLLFIGCSLDDAELLAEIVKQNVALKLNKCNVELITFSDFGQPLIDAVQKLVGCKNQQAEQFGIKQAKVSNQQPQEQVIQYDKITLLTASPLDKPSDTSAVITKLKNYKYPIYQQAFTENNLREADEYSIVILIAKKTSSGLLIEDNNACSDYLAIEELKENLPINSKLTILITDQVFTEQEFELIDFPLIVFSLLGELGKALKMLDKVPHQLFKKPDINHFVHKDFIQSVQLTDELLQSLNPENSLCWSSHIPQIPRDINSSELQGFTGRLSDLASISEKLFKAASRQRLLTIKGSGGLGKTTIAKKVALELASRGHFNAGVFFIDCENITSANQLEMHIGGAFNLQVADDLFGYLAKYHDKQNRLLIFDNLESLLYLKRVDNSQNKHAVEQVKTLLSQILLYASVLVTSRESINSEWEDIYSFREMESEEALALFNHLTKACYISDGEQEFVRRKILEPLLNNNPLAIKLIFDGMVKGKNLRELQQELENDFFGEVKEADLILMFDDEIDANINRQESLYISILYSYQTLSKTQKSAFESFSLFPDGIDLSTFKRIIEESKKTDRNKDASKFKHLINDKDIRVLTDKSLVESNHGFYKLQSVIHRFARFRFEKYTREEDQLALYQHALRYNQKVMHYISELGRTNKKAYFIFLSIFNNLLAAIYYGTKESVIMSESELVIFFEMADDICTFSNVLNLSSDFFVFFNNLNVDNIVKDDNKLVKLAWQLIGIRAMYYNGEFDSAFNQLKNLITQEQLMCISEENDEKNSLVKLIKGNAQNIYTFEGGALDELLHDIKNNRYRFIDIGSEKVHLAINVEQLLSLTHPGLNYFEAQKYLKGTVELEQIEQTINQLHQNEHLERVGLTYLKSRDYYVNYDSIDKLVSVNPYTRGLKNLMYAFSFEHKLTTVDSQTEFTTRIIGFYLAALPELKHIKFYYAQAYYFIRDF